MKARKLIESCKPAKQLVKNLLEGTVIVINGGNNSAGSSSLEGAIQQLLTADTGNGGSSPKVQEPEMRQAAAPSGKRWNFRVIRDSAGSITSIQAEEL